MKIGAVVILYHPDSDLQKRLLTYLPLVEKLFIFDNSENKDNSQLVAGLSWPEKINYRFDNENKGISVRLNQAVQMAIDEKLDWLLTMDQDSYFDGDNFPNFLRCLQNFSEKHSIAMVGAQYIDPSLQSSTCSVTKTRHLITSGSFLNLNLFTSVGTFDEALFIDQVDSEYCYRAILKNYEIVQFNNIYFQHSLGKQSTHRSLKNLKKTTRSLHTPLRLYYMTRNYLYMRSKYQKHFPTEIAELKGDLLNRIKNNFLYSSHRLHLIKSILSGIIDYKRNRMGKKS